MDTGRFGSPTSGVSCRRSASELCVRGGHGWFRSTASRFQARALPTELHDHGAGPGTRTRIDWVTKPAPIPLGPAGTSRAALITPRRPEATLVERPRRAATRTEESGVAGATSDSVGSSVAAFVAVSGTTSCSRLRRMECALLSGGSGGRCRTLISRTKTLRPAVGRLPSGWSLEGSMGTAPITRGWKPHVYLSTP